MNENTICTLLSRHNVNAELITEVRELFAMADNESFKTITATLYETPVALHATPVNSHLGNEDGTLVLTSNLTQSEVSLDTERVPNPPLRMIGRYEDLGPIGRGGMGEVRRIRDRELNRSLAMKIIHDTLLRSSSSVVRFVGEGQVGAQLQHPNIVPVHELGCLDDGRLYFTMQEIKGREFSASIESVHNAIENNRWHTTHDGWNFRRLIDVFHQVCSAVAYAHSKGVIHRDLKPENIMIGSFGEVLVVDWGIAKVIGRTDYAAEAGDLDVVVTERSKKGNFATQQGQVAGTPNYMAPEQAKGEINKIDARTDIYALGAILYELLTGRTPYEGDSGLEVLEQVLRGPPKAIRAAERLQKGEESFKITNLEDKETSSGPPLPLDLIVACERAMQRESNDRFQDVEELAQVLLDWLDGAKKREQALKVVEEALQANLDKDKRKQRASALRLKAEKGLKDIPIWESEEVKRPFWELEEKANEIDNEVEHLSIVHEQLLKGALTHKSDLVEAHIELAKLYRKTHERSEMNQDIQTCIKSEYRLIEHTSLLPEGHPERIRLLHYLKGTGAVSLRTDVEGADFTLERYEKFNRRLIATSMKALGKGSIDTYSLEMGSYRLGITKVGYHDVVYPVNISRGEHWDCIPDSGSDPLPVQMLPLGSLSKDDCYVPAGWYWSGGDPLAIRGLPRRRIWIDGLIFKRFPISNREYLFFLNDLVVKGLEEKAFKAMPREALGDSGSSIPIIYEQGPDGLFHISSTSKGLKVEMDWPVALINWSSALLYSQWESKRTGLDWRLPFELEWEKSARGVDDRTYPWGDETNPSFGHVDLSYKKGQHSRSIYGYPIDESVYGIRGLGGNVMDWTSSKWREEGPVIENNRFVENLDPFVVSFDRVLKGGGWNYNSAASRIAFRYASLPNFRRVNRGFRLCRSLE